MKTKIGRPFVLALWTYLTALLVVITAQAGPTTDVGPYRVEVTTEPSVIAVGEAKLAIAIDAADGRPATGLQVRAIARMPGMPMGEQEERAVPDTSRPGLYVAPTQFPMAGGYDVSVKIATSAGAVAGHVPLHTGENTSSKGTGTLSKRFFLWLLAAFGLAFTMYKVRRSGQRVHWTRVLNRQVVGGLLLLIVIGAISLYSVHRYRRPGAMTPIEAQSMEMEMPAPPGTLPVELATVQRGAVRATVRYSGQAVGNVDQKVYPRVAGVITWMPFYVGDRVARGQLLATLDTTQYRPLVAERRAAVAEAEQGAGVARAQYQQALGAIDQAEAEVGMKQGANEDAQSQVTKAKAEVASRVAAFSNARSQQKKAVAALQEAQSSARGAQSELKASQGEADAAREERASAESDLTAEGTQVTDAQAQLQTAQANQRYWSKEIERMQVLLKAGVVSHDEYERKQAQTDEANAKVRQAQARIQATHAMVQSAQAKVRAAIAMAVTAAAKTNEAAETIAGSESRVAQARAEVSAAQATVGQMAADAEAARAGIASSLARVEEAQSELLAHHAHVSQAMAAAKAAQQQVGQAEARADGARTALQAAITTLGYTQIRAETDGVVTRRNISPGVLVSPGQAILEISQMSPIRIQANVAETDLNDIAVGAPVSISSQDSKAVAVIARITSVAPAVDPAARTGVVEALLPNSDGRFRPGQYVAMEITTQRHLHALHVPTTAIQWRTVGTGTVDDSKSTPFVWVAHNSGESGQYTVHQVEIRTGISDGENTEILSGLTEGQHVVTIGNQGLADGVTVSAGRGGSDMLMAVPPPGVQGMPAMQSGNEAVR